MYISYAYKYDKRLKKKNYTNTMINNRLHSPFVRKPFCIYLFFWRSPRHLQIKGRRGKYTTGIGTPENIINIILCRGTTGSSDMDRRS